MATMNPFDLLGDDDAEDPSQLIAAHQPKPAAALPTKKAAPAQAKTAAPPLQAAKPVAKLPSKPLPPSQAVREARSETGRGRGGGRGFGRGGGGGGGGGGGRGGGGYRDSGNNESSFGNSGAPAGEGGAVEGGESGRQFERRGGGGGGGGGGYGGPRSGGGGAYRGGRRGGFSNGEDDGERPPRRVFERRSGTGRGSEVKREGSGRGNWGTQSDDIAPVTEEANETEKNLGDEKPAGEGDGADGNKENPANETEEKEPEDKEMTLEEYEKVREEKRKALQAPKTEERKVDTKEFESMQQLSNKKENNDIFIKLGSEKDKRREALEKEEKAKKSVSINEFLKPAEGERFFNPGGRGRGRGRGSRGGYGGNAISNVEAPPIEDPSHFPTLGAK